MMKRSVEFCIAMAVLLISVYVSAAQDVEPDQHFSAQQLERLLAPIALYPDALLAQLLIATTHPEAIAAAVRWQQRHSDLRDDDLEDAIAAQSWDPSIKALLFLPSELIRLDTYPDWREDLCTAFLYQEDALMESVQRLRWRAREAGHLESNAQQQVHIVDRVIFIQPADPSVVYVPHYNPNTIYLANEEVNNRIHFGSGVLLGGLLTAAILWNKHDRGRGSESRHVYDGDHRQRHDPGYWQQRDYWKIGNRDSESRHHSGANHSFTPPMQPWIPQIPPRQSRFTAPHSDRLESMRPQPVHLENQGQDDSANTARAVNRVRETIRNKDHAAPSPIPNPSPVTPLAEQRPLNMVRRPHSNEAPPAAHSPVPEPVHSAPQEPNRPRRDHVPPPPPHEPSPQPANNARAVEQVRRIIRSGDHPINVPAPDASH